MNGAPRSFRQMELGVAGDLRRLGDLARQVNAAGAVERIESALGDLEGHRFTLAVVGEFKRGKSTFINALLGKEILPADVMPTSATLNRITYGLRPAVRICFRADDATGPGREEEIGLDQLADYVTKLTPEAEAMARRVREAVIIYPVPFCKNNVDILDTPGLSDDETMTEVTCAVLPRVHAAILVVMADAPFSETEGSFLDHLLLQGISRVVFVVTALDRISRPEDRPRVLQEVARRIESRLRQEAERRFPTDPEERQRYLEKAGPLRVFGVSGREALAARISGDEARRAASGFPPLEEALDRLLTEESGEIVLRSWLHQTSAAGAEVLEAADRRASRLQEERERAGATARVALALLELLLQMAQEERRLMDAAVARAKERAAAALVPFPAFLIQSVQYAVQGLSPSPADLEPSRLEATLRTFAPPLAEAVRKAVVGPAVQVRQKVEEELAAERQRLQPFAVAFGRIWRHLESLLGAAGEAPVLAALLAAAEPLPEERFEAALTPPFAWLNNTFQAVLTATRQQPTWMTRTVSSLFPAEVLKNRLKQLAAQEIQQQLQARPTPALVVPLTEGSLAGLTQALDAAVERVQALQDAFRRRREREELWSDRERQDLEGVAASVRQILERARSVERELRQSPVAPATPVTP